MVKPLGGTGAGRVSGRSGLFQGVFFHLVAIIGEIVTKTGPRFFGHRDRRSEIRFHLRASKKFRIY